MAKSQTRRSVSLRRPLYDAARRLASQRNLTLSHLTESALIAAGVEAKPGEHMTPALASKAMQGKRRVAQ